MIAPLLVIAIGNPSRGDDALAPLLLDRLQGVAGGLGGRVDLLEDFQLQVEHAADMHGRERVLFVDAGAHTPPPFLFSRLQAHAGRPLLSHALPPEDVLAAYLLVYQQQPPPSFVLCISGTQFELGEPLSARAAAHLEAASRFCHRLLHADLAAWEQLARTPAAQES